MVCGALEDVTRKRNDPVVPPLHGAEAFLNPRSENPLCFLELDLDGTFDIVAREDLAPIDRERAEFSIETLNLNRDMLRKARKTANECYQGLLQKYLSTRDVLNDRQREIFIDGLKAMPHPTVWAEMKRQHSAIPELSELFDQAPEALDW